MTEDMDLLASVVPSTSSQQPSRTQRAAENSRVHSDVWYRAERYVATFNGQWLRNIYCEYGRFHPKKADSIADPSKSMSASWQSVAQEFRS